ncbi:conserved phage C-terminal domain-containing protein [Staphylococcus epidermidis]|uniref:conserved phage C-terminal domain-containing protein n=1 Tax=Staphylococcus epidermidis TaxID=1282 RepID=UPI0020B2D6E9|nr:conserved phage C-terminal domain-containing protein [Staphylococcus epidermidis]UTF81182.1 conserved phage C-terminal domain-containing protein [Staphylococcus epidermidis]
MSNLLIDDYPILVLPALASEIGLNEAIVLQQMHYWLKKSNHNYDGRRWIYNSFPEWQKHFPFWSVMTIKRAVYSLEKQNILYVGNYNKAKFDKTKWYSINYEKLEGMKRPSYQNDTTNVSKRNDGVYQNDTTNTRDYTEITTETTNNNILSGNPTASRIPYKEIVDYLNEKTGKNFKHKTAKTRKFIEARWNQDFRLDDFKKVIDVKTDEWLNTDSDKYLRPETLFGTKFEGYLNQKTKSTGMDQLERMKYDESYWD